MPKIMKLAERHNLKIVEDACQSLGSSVEGKGAGAYGDTGCFSFYPFKILGGYGDGGAITTNDEEVYMYAKRMRFNGEDRETGEYFGHGYTCLLDNLQAAFLDVKLAKLLKVTKTDELTYFNLQRFMSPHFAKAGALLAPVDAEAAEVAAGAGAV